MAWDPRERALYSWKNSQPTARNHRNRISNPNPGLPPQSWSRTPPHAICCGPNSKCVLVRSFDEEFCVDTGYTSCDNIDCKDFPVSEE